MFEMSLVCREKIQGVFIEVESPSVGKAHVLVNVDHMVTGGQIVAHFWRLNQCYVLKVSDQCEGRVVKVKNKNKLIDLAYGESFLLIDPVIFHKTKDLSKSIDVIDANKKDEDSIDSPMDGMLYLSSSPESPPFVRIGDSILPGQTLGLIEVMKCFYPLKYQGDKVVKITDVRIKSGKPVACGTQIFIISER
jgi:biotin carboxyl carrier protein